MANNYTQDQLEKINSTIEGMSKLNHVEILKICVQNNITTNENVNGNFINLSILPTGVIERIEKYIQYVAELEHMIQTIEQQKETYRFIFDEDTSQTI